MFFSINVDFKEKNYLLRNNTKMLFLQHPQDGTDIKTIFSLSSRV